MLSASRAALTAAPQPPPASRSPAWSRRNAMKLGFQHAGAC
jgi:hypothetical protein